MTEQIPLVTLNNLRVVYNIGKHQRTVIDDIDYILHHGEILGVVGESGSGKTQSAFSILGIENSSPGIVFGEVKICFHDQSNGINLGDLIHSTTQHVKTENGVWYKKNEFQWKKTIKKIYKNVRGKRIFLMFQDPRSYLNPFWTIDKHFQQVVPKEIQKATPIKTIMQSSLTKFGLNDVAQIATCYPHELSGGMNQRVMIALGYACRPDVIIADEITTGLDVVNQKAVVNHLKQLMKTSKENGAANPPGIILISHDLGFVSKLADTIFVMYAGQGMEYGDAKIILDPRAQKKHPYTKELVEIYLHKSEYIRGDPPKLDNPPSGCRFHERCTVFENNRHLGCDITPPRDFTRMKRGKHQIRCKLFEKD